jgi:ferrochelatase
MRYGNPSTKSRLEAMQQAGCTKILLAPLYPQYSATTTATANDKAFDALKKMRWQPAVRTLPAYSDEPAYVAALARSIDEGVKALPFTPDVILTSYHGMPELYLKRGDPYHCQCLKTTRLVREHLGWDESRIMVTFQSRFGPTKWLEPYTEPTLVALAQAGTHSVDVMCPGFTGDCLETLEEINMEAREAFLHAGGTSFSYIACLNDSPQWLQALGDIAQQHLAGWPTQMEPDAQALAASRAAALAMGAEQ